MKYRQGRVNYLLEGFCNDLGLVSDVEQDEMQIKKRSNALRYNYEYMYRTFRELLFIA